MRRENAGLDSRKGGLLAELAPHSFAALWPLHHIGDANRAPDWVRRFHFQTFLSVRLPTLIKELSK